MNEDKPAVVAICKVCEGICLAVVTEHLCRKDKNEFGRMAADGYEVKTVTCETVRKGKWCECRKGKKK